MTMMQRFFLLFLVALSFSLTVQGRVFANIDTFSSFQPALFLNIDTTDPSAIWYSPYGEAAGLNPAVLYHDTTDALGGQRDLICGHFSNSDDGSSASVSIEQAEFACSVGISLGFFGSCYVQWDGNDNGGTTNPFPGADLNAVPGIGSAGNPHSTDGQSMDFTFGGFATAITSTVRADHDVFYYYKVINLAGQENQFRFFTQGGELQYTFAAYFNHPDWSNLSFDWTTVVALQVRIQTAEASGTTSTAVDTDFRFLNVVGYEVTGEVFVDCECDGTASTYTQGATVNLFNATSNTQLATTTTDAGGQFRFENLRDGLYRACLASASNLCSGSPQCVDFTLADFVDPPKMQFSTTVVTTLTPPPNTQIRCDECSTPACLGNAVENGCNGQVEITNPNDVQSGTECNRIITRTWTSQDGSLTRTQTITIVDNQPPALQTAAVSSSAECGSAGGDTIDSWLARNADASVTDCNTYTWSNNYPGNPVLCGAVTVTFTARDVCGLATATTATFTITDATPPTQVQAPTPGSAPCDLKGTSVQTAYNTWLNNRAGATATDSCDTDLTWTSNNPTVQNGCDATTTVTWTVRDDCGNTLPVTSTFTVTDNAAPVITTPASDRTAECTSGGTQTAFQSWLNSRGGAQATDNCIANDASLTWSNNWDGTSVPTGCASGLPITFTVTDPCGFTATTTATFSVTDSTPPQLTRPAQGSSVQCSGGDGSVQTAFQQWLANNGGATATDDCSTVTWSNDASTAPADGCTNGLTVTFTAQDSCNGLTVATTATFTVQDSTSPTVTTPPTNSQADCVTDVNSAFQQWLASAGGAQATDNCGSVSFVNDFTGTGPNIGCNAVTPVRFTAVDQCGLRASPITATFTVTDTNAPSVTQASPLNLQCDATTQQAYQDWLNNHGGATGSDACATALTWSHNGPSSIPQNCNSAVTVTFTVRDPCGQTASTTATASVTDGVPPTLTRPASNGQAECGSANDSQFNTWLNSNAGAQATDNCGGVTWSNDFTPNSWVNQLCTRVASVTFTARDSCGNQITTSAQYQIDNTLPPTITTPASSTSVNCDSGNGNAFADYLNNHGGARATDACTPADQLVWTNTAGNVPVGCGAVPVTFTVTDPCGGSASTTATFTVVDQTRPTWVQNPTSPSVECDGTGNVAEYQSWVASNGGAQASDNCALSVMISNNAPNAGPVGCGSVPVTFTATDECGNSVSITATFTVVDTQAPTVSPAFDQSVECDNASNDEQLQEFLNSHGGATASDSCYAVSQLTWRNDFTSLTNTPCDRFATVTFTVTDPCGQRASTTATFRITDTTSPVVDQPEALILECGSSNNADIQEYINNRGGGSAVDSCSTVTWTLEPHDAPVPCEDPTPIIWNLVDACGNCASAYGSVVITDNIPPEFVNFPADIVVGCDRETTPDVTGYPGGRDNCWADLDLGFSDAQVQLPDYRFCPGDIIITRTWALIDQCGNHVSREQTIVHEIARRVGPCIDEPCPPCETVCCAEQTRTIECNAVPCNAVECHTVPCGSVPCVPQNCDGTGGSADCEPVYIYVFNDDDDNTVSAPDFIERSSAGVLGVSLFSLLIVALSVLF